ncbi:hypothetical protein HU200_051390 [Digitaria exilis]|uniref:Calponin-homology (CH) domain-containing protein n=1 Tax=Digitaria exilis TaxID=1010633 RepID=A0A835AUM0_9POAL|nr:hypothetical protein HU200_051390 [Digitaria exilis]
MTPAMVAALRDSLREVCSLDDVTERMEMYMSKDACEEVLVMMTQICKNIDEGRLKMKAHCPLATDLGLKEKAIRIFMCYSPDWLRIGLHIVLGGDSLLQNGLGKRDKEFHFLKRILEKHMFSQIMIAKSSAPKKIVEGHVVQCYSRASDNIILKRIFLFVAALDRAKIESALPLEAGIDGLDGGSPLLFCHQGQVKSSRQIIQDSLGEAMHGEGDLLMHLTTMGYKLNYHQPALSEYDFNIKSLFEDLQDGMILCRVVQLLLSDASVILKVIVPSDTNKKRLSNCTTAIQYIKKARVPLSDSDGVTISAEDIVAGDKELILSLLWNVFIHMQLPLLTSTLLSHELTRLSAPVMENRISESKSHVGLLYDWVQVICSKYAISVDSSSQFDRRALNCVVNYYLNIDIFPHEVLFLCRKELFTSHELDTLADITRHPSSKMGKVLADVLQVGTFLCNMQDIPGSGILADGVLSDERSVILFLCFLCSHLTNDERLDQLKTLMNMKLKYERPDTKISATRRGKNDVKYQPQTENKNGSCTNQGQHCKHLDTLKASAVPHIRCSDAMDSLGSTTPQQPSDKQSNSITSATQPCKSGHDSISPPSSPSSMLVSSCKGTASSQSCEVETTNVISVSKLVSEDDMGCGCNISSQAFFEHKQLVSTCIGLPARKASVAAQRIQSAYGRFLNNRLLKITAAIKIQSHWRCYSVRKCFTKQVQAIVGIQNSIRLSLHHQARQRQELSAVFIQRVVRGWFARNKMLG